ncbi:presequence protease, mitochondrial [Hetaerina americana]|uniref:presequence protease, mitochondrial n=1 Tax=Hetaerina americana TaxID=62018 RepID=UPI003A7F15CD
MNLLDMLNRNTRLLSSKGVRSTALAATMPMRNYKFAFSANMKHTSAKLFRLPCNLVASKADGNLSWNVNQTKEGSSIEGWQVEEVSPVKDFHLTALRLKHPQTGARFLHLARADRNQTFSVGFRTPPPDSSGLPHILEHTVLCGSQLFPVRDPFFKMLGGRTLATFMNAMTGPDYTMYPFATRDPADFGNLMSIYLDAVFRPRLRETDFRQEGWRLEHADPFDSSSPIVFKGVVFNEMKGAFSDPQSLFGQRLLCSLLPKGAYGKVSGGEPLTIPSLSWEDLRSFHAQYYHPGNARFFTYGELNLPRVLEYITENYVEASAKELPAVPEILQEPRWSKPREEHVNCSRDPMAPNPENQSTVAVAAACCDIHDLNETFLLDVLSDLLIRGPEAPFYSRLIEPGLGSGYAPATGYDSSTRDTIFAVGLQGLKSSDVEKAVKSVKEAVNAALSNGEGLEPERVEAVLHRVELAARDESHCMGSSLGLSLLSEITPLWNHDGDIVSFLRVGDRVEFLKRSLKNDPNLLRKATEKYLGEKNSHQLILTMSPKEGFEEMQLKEEQELLQSKIDKLSSQDKEHIVQFGMKLAKEQKQDEDLTCLPRLCASDLSPIPEPDGAVNVKDTMIPIQYSVQPTNGVAYIRATVDVAGLPEDLNSSLPLFCLIASKMGTSHRNARDFDRAVSLSTGGISFGVNVVAAPAPACSPLSLRAFLVMSTMCLERNAAKALKLCSELWQAGAKGSWMDSNRLAVLLREEAVALANGVPHSGHAYAVSAAAARVSPAARKREHSVLGPSYLEIVRKAASQASQSETGAQEILNKIREVGAFLLDHSCGDRLRFSINSSPESEPSIINEVSTFLKTISVGPSSSRVNPFEMGPTLSPELQVAPNTHYVLPLPVNFAAKAIATGVAFKHPDHAPLKILAKLLSARYLHPHIREEGGAYGSGADISTDGVFSFFSYRDPHSIKTLDVFNGSGKWAINSSPKPITETYLEEAKIGIFQRVDAPVPPGNRGLDRFLRGVDDELLKWHREALMTVTCDDLVRVASEYLSVTSKLPVSCALLGPQNDVLEKDSNWKIIVPED